jgi:hypothetical protein
MAKTKAEKTPAPRRAERSVPQTEFVWQVYADATLAGVAKLVPIPFVDVAIEEYFRRRMPRDIAWYNGRVLPEPIMRQVNRRRSSNPLMGCLMLPFKAITYLLRDILRTVLYALTVADAAENLGYYWHRAFLLNYAIQQGHLDDNAHTQPAMAAIDRTLSEVTTSPVLQLAQQVIINWKRQLSMVRTYVRYARGKADPQRVQEVKDTMSTAWGDYSEYWEQVADTYDNAYESARLFEQVKVQPPTTPSEAA